MDFFTLQAQSQQARAGVIRTSHGVIETPIFMPVGTRASVKALTQEQLELLNAPIILGNTYHLFLRPGHQVVEDVGGGLHGFMSWSKAILTDSGGYQVYSLSDKNKITEEGVKFQSFWDGLYHMMTPELSMEIQRSLGADIVMCFDECPALPASLEKLEESMRRTLRWAKRCSSVKLKDHQHLFAIVQGGLDWNLRKECLDELKEGAYAGFALGGLSVGEKNQEMVSFCQEFVPHMPSSKPRYLMGVGTPMDVLKGIRAGLDMFDCVLPTRNARNGQVFTLMGPYNIKKAQYEKDTGPLDDHCRCWVCGRYKKSYIRHLYRVGESLASTLMSFHNLWFMLEMVRDARRAIMEQRFEQFYQERLNLYQQSASVLES